MASEGKPSADDSTRRSLEGRILVKGGLRDDDTAGRQEAHPLLVSNVSLSFWGGIDPITGIVIDKSHPLHGTCVASTILCLPSGRGSCTASQVLLELILRGLAPQAIVLRDPDGLVCVGALIAQEIFQNENVPDIVCLGDEGFQQLLSMGQGTSLRGRVQPNGTLELGNRSSIQSKVNDEPISTLPIESTYSPQEKELLQSASTEAEAMALRVIFQYAHLLQDAPTYIPIAGAHIDGCTYIGPGGLEFVQRLVAAHAQVKVPTTLNSVSADRNRWKALGVPIEYAQNSIALGDAYLKLGCQPSFTCAPYLLPNVTAGPQQDVAWGESNAVVFANSVLGARTEKYADYLDICCAIAGIVPKVGVHCEENRRPKVILDASEAMQTLFEHNQGADFDLIFPVLGHLCGTLSDGRVPIVLGLENRTITKDHLKAFCAAFGTTAASPLIHIVGITPEAKDEAAVESLLRDRSTMVTKAITLEQLEQTYRELDSGNTDSTESTPIDLIALGNPHLSTSECESLSNMADGTAKTRIIACISREIHSMANPQHLEKLNAFGVEFVFDTCWCMLLDPPIIPAQPNAVVLTNSGKYAHYGPGLVQRHFRMGSMADCMEAARTGVLQRNTRSPWLSQTVRSFATGLRRFVRP